ncbi:EF-hand domain-containing protein [Zavarzinia sp. CC-PAN008]|uniref:EF-hand domain-containing protein n=1 Tax=Zavarzinia sp. CC-PAN008 TaxID=3243332 RepID=UPI003F74A2E6
MTKVWLCTLVAAGAAVSLLAGCGGGGDSGKVQGGFIREEGGPPPTTLFGEPLRGATGKTCATDLAQWIQGMDTNGDGGASLDELQANGQAWFLRADANKDGYITAPELSAIRRAISPESEVMMSGAPPPVTQVDQSQHAAAGTPNTVRPQRRQAGLPIIADPVMAADRNLDFRVSPEELATVGAERFARYDTNRNGLLEPAEMAATCRAPD